MLNGFNFLICGSGPITNSHLKVLKHFDKVRLKKIFSKNTFKAKELALKFKLILLEDLNKENIDDCNICLITNSSESHFNLIKILSNQIKIFIVEKPMVEDSSQLRELSNLIKNKHLKIFEVSQFLFSNQIAKIMIKRKARILIKKKRVSSDFFNFKNIKTKDKSVVFRQFPHWYDVAKKIAGGNISLNKFETNIHDLNADYLKVYLYNSRINVEIEINLNCEKNYSPVILADNKKIVLKQSIWNKFCNIIKLNNFNLTEIYLNDMYKNFLFKTKKNEYENNIDFEKYKVFGKIFHKLRTEI